MNRFCHVKVSMPKWWQPRLGNKVIHKTPGILRSLRIAEISPGVFLCN